MLLRVAIGAVYLLREVSAIRPETAEKYLHLLANAVRGWIAFRAYAAFAAGTALFLLQLPLLLILRAY